MSEGQNFKAKNHFNSYHSSFAPTGDMFIAEFGSEASTTTGGKPTRRLLKIRLLDNLTRGIGHRVSRIDIRTENVTPFAISKTGVAASVTGGGFERPIDVVFVPSGEMYIVDFCIFPPKG